MKSNMLNIRQLVEKNYKVLIEDKMMRVLESNGRIILKVPMSLNRTFKIELNMMEHKRLPTASIRDY